MMKIETQFFSRLRDLVGQSTQTREVPPGATVGDFLATLYRDYPALEKWDAHLLVAVGLEYATRTQTLHEGDVVSIMPPVQGG